MTVHVNITPVVASLMMSEGISVIAGCEHDDSQAGAILALKYNCPRWAAEAAVRGAIRRLARCSAHLLNTPEARV